MNSLTPSRQRMADERRSVTGRKNAATANWTNERVELLKTLWADGMSGSQIADELGGGVTRMAVAGKVHRLKLTGRKQQPSRIKAEKKKHGKTNKHGVSPFYKLGQNEADAMAKIKEARQLAHNFMAAAPEHAPNSNPVSLLDIGPAQCRYPLWAGDAPKGSAKLFCGAPVGKGWWCEFHRQTVYRTVNSMERYDEKKAVKISDVELAAGALA